MAVEIRVAHISFGTGDDGKPTAIAAFHISAKPDRGRVAEDFTVEIGILGETDPTTVVNEARKALRKLALDLVDETDG